MLEKVKNALHITHNKLDSDIIGNINVALADMARVGVNTEGILADSEGVEPLIEKTVELYCKWMYDYLGKANDWKEAYVNLRDSLALCWRYRGGQT